MKSSFVSLILAVLVGVGVGWFLRGVGLNDENEGVGSDGVAVKEAEKRQKNTPDQVDESGFESSGSTSRVTVERTGLGGDGVSSESEEFPTEIENQLTQYEKQIVKRYRSRFEKRLRVLVKKLGLTKEQEEKFREKWQGKEDSLAKLFSEAKKGEDVDQVEGFQKVSELTEKDGFSDDLMSEVLTEEQLEGYEELKEKELKNRVESRTMREMSKLGFLDLTEDQKDLVYEVLYEQSQEKESKPDGVTSAMSLVMGGGGLSQDYFEDSGYLELMMEEAKNGGTGEEAEGQDWMARMKESMQKRVEAKVGLLKDVLTDEQSAQYREHLEEKNQGVFGIFGGASSSEKYEVDSFPTEE